MNTEVELSHIKFRLTSLSVSNALSGLQLLTNAIAAVASGDGENIDPRSIVGVVEDLPRLLALMLPTAEVQFDKGKAPGFIDAAPDAPWVKLSGLSEAVFSGRTTLLLAFLGECVAFQYADFLTESGRQVLVTTVNRLISQAGLTGGSGES